MKNSRVKILVSVVLFLIGGILLLTTAMVSVVQEAAGGFSSGEKSEIIITPHQAKRMGTSMMESKGDEAVLYEAYEGYAIYKLTFDVTNHGVEETYGVDFGLDFIGHDYDDVYQFWMDEPYYEEEPLFYYDYLPYVPAYRTAKLTRYVQVKEGVEEIIATYYTDIYYENEAEIIIRLP